MAGATGLAQVVVAVLYVVAARESSVADYGQAVAALALGLAAVGIMDFGTNDLWLRDLSAGRLDLTRFSRLAAWKTYYLGLVATVWAVVCAAALPGGPYWISGFVALSQSLSQTARVCLRAHGRAELAGAAILLDRLIAASLFFLMWLVGCDVLVALVLSLAVSPGLSGLLANRWITESGRIVFRITRPLNPWKGTRAFGVASAAVTLRAYGDVPMLALFGGATAAGIYAAVNRWTQPISLLSDAFRAASVPYVASAPSANDAVKHLRSGAWLPVVAILACGVAIIVAPWLVDLLLGDRWGESAIVLQLLAIGTIISILAQPLYVLLMARGWDLAGATIVVLSVAVSLVMVALLGARYGAVGGGLAFVVGQLVFSVGLALTIHRIAATRRARLTSIGD